ncbi:hypothetical protein [Flavobacterium sp.]|jgi:hypothetical protein|uniref:hypothetical protein n=1 Tax=Flavobacterium sp. TaxID=239 RepID=UPI0037BF3BCB
MKKKILLVLIIIFSCYYWYSFTSESEKYEILNEIIKDDELALFKICTKSDKIEIFENNLSDFTFLEQLSVNFQKLTQTEHKFKSEKIQYFNRSLNKIEFCEIIPNCDKQHEIHYKISLPIVSPDKQSVIIKITEDCNCMLGGQSGTYLYKKYDGKWKRIKTLNRRIS